MYKVCIDNETVLDTVSRLMANHSAIDIRRHLSDFLFRSTEEVNLTVGQLSGGEKVRLSLAQIASKTPSLLVLDEVTNNLDLETRQYMIDVLKHYPGVLIVVSHDVDFLAEIEIQEYFELQNGRLSMAS